MSAGKLRGLGGRWLLLYAVMVFPASAEDWATLTFDPATSSSRCIGDPMTPLCAVETYEACYYWVDKKACTAMGLDPSAFRLVPDAYAKLSIYHYRIENRKVIDAEDVAVVAEELDDPRASLGDVVMQVRWEGCSPIDACVLESMNDPARVYGEGCPPIRCRVSDTPLTYLVRDIGGKWQVVDGYEDKTFHDDFWKRK